ncbi:hypothetical protein Sste5346_005034 [Sporothrix stenoceras]|uniref:Tmem1 family n=1 Tax=Sporothrix stenoceras TaxID=5173 RepID=A0ABR3Z757_9PEZI
MEQPFSTSKVTVEYYDPHGLYRLLAPGLLKRLPLRHLHWQSHSGPLRSIDTLHVELVSAESNPPVAGGATARTVPKTTGSDAPPTDDGFQTATVGGRQGSLESTPTTTAAASTSTSRPPERRHQIPGLRRTPYLKLLLVRCDDTDTYKSQTRAEIKDWVKKNTHQGSSGSSNRKASIPPVENHDAFEWMIVHVVLPNSQAYNQPRTSKSSSGGDGTGSDSTTKTTSRWGKNSSTILERLRSDFNIAGDSKSSSSSASASTAAIDRVSQIRVGINDVPYELLPRVQSTGSGTTPPTGTGYVESEREAQAAWTDVVDKLKSRILASFDVRVSQYEDDIREKDVQRTLPGWNFCTFFILKEGLARGFESVGLVDDALVGYDELSVGLDTVIQEQHALTASTLLSFTDDLKTAALKAINGGDGDDSEDSEETVNLQAATATTGTSESAIPISATKKPYRDLILANNVSVFDFRCYIFARQIALLLRLGNAWATREELLTKLQEQQEATMHLTPAAAASHAAASTSTSSSSRLSDDPENLSMLAEICRRTLEFVPAVSQVMREDLLFSLTTDGETLPASSLQIIDNMVASFAFSIAQQILAQTSTRALPIPPSTMTLASDNTQELKVSIPEPKTMMHPARTSSLETRGQQAPTGRGAGGGRPPLSPGIFPGPGQPQSAHDAESSSRFLKAGLEDLAARRADLYMLSRNILQKGGEKLGWSNGWSTAPVLSAVDDDNDEMEEVSLDDDAPATSSPSPSSPSTSPSSPTAGIEDLLLRTALESNTGFYRLYEALTDKALRHYIVAGHAHAVNANRADLAVLKYHLKDYLTAAEHFYETTPFFGENSWGLLELSMLLMYARCLKEMGRNDEYAWRLLKFLTKAADAERQRLEERASFMRRAEKAEKKHPPPSAVQGCLADLLSASTSVSGEMRVPLINFFRLVAVDGPPVFTDGEDSFSITLHLDSLLVDPLPVDSVKVRLTQTSSRGQAREIWLETTDSETEAITLGPGTGRVQLHSRTIIPGIYSIDQVRITSKNLVIFHDRDGAHTVQRLSTGAAAAAPVSTVSTSTTSAANIFAEPHLVLYQRTDALDVQLSTSKDLQLDKNNFLELVLLTGWNDIQHCEMKIRAATGGLRLITTEAKVLGTSGYNFSKPVEGGIVCFDNVPANTSLPISFPFSIEQDVLELCLKVDVTYTTRSGATFHFSKAPSVSTSLALGVNVQDVFKHDALFSRFTVSTATASPLRVFRSELLESDLFTAQLGTEAPNASGDGSVDHSTNLPVVFPKQPVSLLYKIVRKPLSGPLNAPPGKDTKRTMYIKLHYSVFQDQLDAALKASLGEAFTKTASLAHFAKLASACVLRHVHASLSPYDLEKIALLNEMSTSVLAHVNWAREFPGLGPSAIDASKSKADDLAAVIYAWQKKHTVLAIPPADPSSLTTNVRTILIPVDIPSITIVHTADIQLQGPFGAAVSADRFPSDEEDDSEDEDDVSMPIFCVNQLLPATLHLRWTRIWDTGDAESSEAASSLHDDLEFSFEVSAPTDAWLIGGRRKGHFVIPAPDADGSTIGLSSTPALEAAIPLMLIPLREGRLPYPSVEIRQVADASGHHAESINGNGNVQEHPAGHHCETDYRNLGETVHVVADRTRLTLSLDASGPGGGPLVLESERAQVAGRVVV